MPFKYIETQISLPPGLPPPALVEELLRMIFEEFHWFEPVRYGSAALRERVDTEHPGWSELVAYHEKHRELSVAARTDRDFILLAPALRLDSPYTGKLIWMAASSRATKASWRAGHAQQVAEVMRLVGSPLAIAGLETDIHQKKWRLVDRGYYKEEISLVRGYGEGLPGLFWRNFYGPPFMRLFGKRLEALPPECLTRLDGEGILVQPYELPMEAGTEAARAREQHLISLLGPECFYDHEHHRPPTRLPVLDSLLQP